MARKRTTVSMTLSGVLRRGNHHIRLPEVRDPLALHRFTHDKNEASTIQDFRDLDVLVSCLERIMLVHARNRMQNSYVALFVKNGVIWGAATRRIPRLESEHQAARTHVLEAAMRGITHAVPGSSVLTNFPLGDEEARVLRYGPPSNQPVQERTYALVAAPHIDSSAYTVLKPKKDPCRIVENPYLERAAEYLQPSDTVLTQIRGGFLTQERHVPVPKISDRKRRIWGPAARVARHARDMALAWAVGSSSEDIAITVVKNEAVVANASHAIDHSAACSHISSILGFGTHLESVAYCGTPFTATVGLHKLDYVGVRTLLTVYGRGERYETIAEDCQKNGMTLIWFPADYLGR